MILGAPLERSALQAVADGAGTAVALSDGKRLLASAGPDAGQTTLAALVGREDRAGEAGLVTLGRRARRPGRRARSRAVAGRRAAASSRQPAGSHLGLLIAAAGALLGACGPDHPAVRPASRAQGRHATTRWRSRGRWAAASTRVRPASNRSNGRRIRIRPRTGRSRPAPRWPRAARRGRRGGDAGDAARWPGRHARPLPAAGTHRRGRHGGDLHRRRARRRGLRPPLRRQADAPAPGAQPRRRQPVHRRGPAAVRPRALEHRARVRLRARRRGVLPGARIHPRPRPGTAGAAPRRDVRPIAQRAGRLLHHARGAGGARLRARRDRPGRQQHGDRPPRRLAGQHPGVGAAAR